MRRCGRPPSLERLIVTPLHSLRRCRNNSVSSSRRARRLSRSSSSITPRKCPQGTSTEVASFQPTKRRVIGNGKRGGFKGSMQHDAKLEASWGIYIQGDSTGPRKRNSGDGGDRESRCTRLVGRSGG